MTFFIISIVLICTFILISYIITVEGAWYDQPCEYGNYAIDHFYVNTVCYVAVSKEKNSNIVKLIRLGDGYNTISYWKYKLAKIKGLKTQELFIK